MQIKKDSRKKPSRLMAMGLREKNEASEFANDQTPFVREEEKLSSEVPQTMNQTSNNDHKTLRWRHDQYLHEFANEASPYSSVSRAYANHSKRVDDTLERNRANNKINPEPSDTADFITEFANDQTITEATINTDYDTEFADENTIINNTAKSDISTVQEDPTIPNFGSKTDPRMTKTFKKTPGLSVHDSHNYEFGKDQHSYFSPPKDHVDEKTTMKKKKFQTDLRQNYNVEIADEFRIDDPLS